MSMITRGAFARNALTVLFSLAALSCHAQSLEREERNVRGFDAVSLEAMGRLILVQGDSEYLTVEAPREMLQKITAVVKGATLRIGYRGLFGGKSAVLWVTDRLAAALSGKGNLLYVGDPQIQDQAISGAGTISKLKRK